MGTWGTGAFDNDAATDWILDLGDAVSVGLIAEALDPGPGYVDAPAGEVIVAAAALILAYSSLADAEPTDVSRWVAEHRELDVRPLVTGAVAALDRVLGAQSELADLWSESEDEADQWRSEVDRLQHSLLSASWDAPAAAAEPARAGKSRPWWKFWA